MKLSRTFYVLATILLILPIASKIALGVPTPPPPPDSPAPAEGDRIPPPLERLNLTTQQQQKIKSIHEQSKATVESLLQQLSKQDREERSLLASDASDDKIRSQHQQIQKLRQALDDRHFETMLKVRAILTPEQRARLANDYSFPPPPPPPPPPSDGSAR